MSAHTLHGSTFTGYELAPEVRGYRYHVGGYVATVAEAREKLAELREIVSADKAIVWRSTVTREMVADLTPEQIEGLMHELDSAVMNLFDELKGE